MRTVRKDFFLRAKEVSGYFEFVVSASLGEIDVAVDRKTGVPWPRRTQESLQKTLKASCYLVLYNLVESTMRNLVVGIFDDLRENEIRYDACTDSIKRVILLNFRLPSHNANNLMEKLADLAKDVVHETFSAKHFFSGNVDAKSIRKTADKFGFPSAPKTIGWMMESVKDHRNGLAHGLKSFAEVGRDASATSLDEARKQTIRVLALTIRNASRYVKEKQYLAANSAKAS